MPLRLSDYCVMNDIALAREEIVSHVEGATIVLPEFKYHPDQIATESITQSEETCVCFGKPRIRVDFNELLDDDLVLLSKTDEREDSEGNRILLSSGAQVSIYEFHQYDNGEKEWLLAEGVVELNTSQEKPVAKWCCRINERGIVVKDA
jgi:hypothetical protein